MANTEQEPMQGATRLIETIEDTEKSALEAVRKFVDTVNGTYPDLSEADGPQSQDH